jgi:hypothetical protein
VTQELSIECPLSGSGDRVHLPDCKLIQVDAGFLTAN